MLPSSGEEYATCDQNTAQTFILYYFSCDNLLYSIIALQTFNSFILLLYTHFYHAIYNMLMYLFPMSIKAIKGWKLYITKS
jgi:hypothetical protein